MSRLLSVLCVVACASGCETRFPSSEQSETSGTAQVGTVGTRLPEPLTITLRSHDGWPLADWQISWFVLSGSATLSETGTVTDGQGRTLVQVTLGPEAGPVEVGTSSEGYSGRYQLEALPGPLASVTHSPTELVVFVGASEPLSFVPADEYGNPLSGVPLIYFSDDDRIATVTAEGVVTGVAPGKTHVTATTGERSGQVLIDVRAR